MCRFLVFFVSPLCKRDVALRTHTHTLPCMTCTVICEHSCPCWPRGSLDDAFSEEEAEVVTKLARWSVTGCVACLMRLVSAAVARVGRARMAHLLSVPFSDVWLPGKWYRTALSIVCDVLPRGQQCVICTEAPARRDVGMMVLLDLGVCLWSGIGRYADHDYTAWNPAQPRRHPGRLPNKNDMVSPADTFVWGLVPNFGHPLLQALRLAGAPPSRYSTAETVWHGMQWRRWHRRTARRRLCRVACLT
jgi:hypothetical protein